MGRIKSRTFVWHFDCPVEKIWPVLADTERFNEAAELPRQVIESEPKPDGSIDLSLKPGSAPTPWSGMRSRPTGLPIAGSATADISAMAPSSFIAQL